MSWDLLLLTTLFVAFLSLWSLRSYLAGTAKFVYAVAAAVLLHVFGREVMHRVYFTAHEAVVSATPVARFQMVITLGAVVWLLHRAFQTLWKPASELVNILGVDIPQAPEVCLAGIRSDAATLAWSRPHAQRLAPKYLIQVNGVQVGEATGNEAGITITGLKPNHFYNIRVIAVGHNNFRSGSPVIRLRTFGKDGRPLLGNSRLPSNFVDPEQSHTDINGDPNDAKDPGSSLPAVEATPVLDGVANTSRDTLTVAPGQRRNTMNKRHSSVPSSDQAQTRFSNSNEPELSLPELNHKFENTRKEIETTVQLIAKEQAEAAQQEEELKKERDRKRLALKEKEEQTTQLRATIRSTMEMMRTAEKERQKKEQLLKEKQYKEAKIRDSIVRLENEIEQMKKGRQGFQTQREELAEKRDNDIRHLDESTALLQEKCAALEADLKDRGKQLQLLKAERERLPGANDEQWKEEDMRLKQEWNSCRRDLHDRCVEESKQAVLLDQQIRSLTQQLAVLQQHQQAGLNFYNQPSCGTLDYESSAATQNATGLSFPGSGSGRGGTPMSSPPPLAPAEPNFQGRAGFNPITYGHGFFVDMPSNAAGTSRFEAELRAGGGPLSPTAQTLLPSNIFDDTEESEEVDEPGGPKLLEPSTADDDNPRSPVSPAPSYRAFPSPRGSNPSLPFTHYTDTSSLNHAPVAPPASGHRLTSLLSNFHKSSRTAKTSEQSGPPIGTLKPGQSQSFPRGLNETDALENRRRYWPWNSKASTSQDASLGSSHPLSSGLNNVNSLKISRISAISDRDRGHSRPSSITSMDRPSTDSGSIWGAPGDVTGLVNRVWSANDNPWPSRTGSRRPSLHGSTTALTTTLASADDEILDDDDLIDPQTLARQVGVIGSRPPVASPDGSPFDSSKPVSQRLDPTARPFKLIFGMRGQDKEKERERDKDRTRDKGKGKEVATPSMELIQNQDDSLSDYRTSRDTYSVHTGTSVSESHESLPLDLTQSNTSPDVNATLASSLKESDNVVKKLFRKGSSGKFGLSSRLGKESGLFKKSPGSTTNSDRNASSEQRSSIGDADDLGDDGALFGRSYDSMASSSSLGLSKSKESRESRMSSWRFSMRKKSKDTGIRERESMEMDRASDED
ncbi:hypothetical protein E4U42_003125 [Claviceps africana]|uniref:Fibronectin type-III domain-containing protein n=1 Tax=Claviceps africana TaxID=83212 RepID=A0A8K0J7D4_9HYPO|nr:hypothetical protein E4U42_003125 [Claviceps africana]